MKKSFIRLSLLSVPLALLLLSASMSSSAMDRSRGDFWVYSMVITVPDFGTLATGSMRYEFVSQELLTVGGAQVPVNVMRVTGSALGSVTLIDLTVEVVIEGYVYEAVGNMSTVRSDLTYWYNITWGSGDFPWPLNSAQRSVRTYTPPLLSGFKPGTTVPGAVWSESISVTTSSYNMTTGQVESETTDLITVYFKAHTELETVSTGAGSFETLRINATESSGDRIVYWWSEEIGLFVKEVTYLEGTAEPVQTLTLEDYAGKPKANILVFVAVGGLATAVALTGLALVLIKRRPPRPGEHGPEPLELLPPPP